MGKTTTLWTHYRIFERHSRRTNRFFFERDLFHFDIWDLSFLYLLKISACFGVSQCCVWILASPKVAFFTFTSTPNKRRPLIKRTTLFDARTHAGIYSKHISRCWCQLISNPHFGGILICLRILDCVADRLVLLLCNM